MKKKKKRKRSEACAAVAFQDEREKKGRKKVKGWDVCQRTRVTHTRICARRVFGKEEEKNEIEVETFLVNIRNDSSLSPPPPLNRLQLWNELTYENQETDGGEKKKLDQTGSESLSRRPRFHRTDPDIFCTRWPRESGFLFS